MRRLICSVLMAAAAVAVANSEPVELKAVKDNTSRSNERMLNNGRSAQLAIAHGPVLRSIVAFDLASITNEIVSAELRFTMANTVKEPVTMVVAPMVQTKSNAAWEEGIGNLGVQGQNARPGEACYARSRHPDTSWESASGTAVEDLGAAALWMAPIAQLKRLKWAEGDSLKIPVSSTAMLEKIRTSDEKIVTFGMWGTDGNGIYTLHSKDSGKGPVLVLTLKEEKK